MATPSASHLPAHHSPETSQPRVDPYFHNPNANADVNTNFNSTSTNPLSATVVNTPTLTDSGRSPNLDTDFATIAPSATPAPDLASTLVHPPISAENAEKPNLRRGSHMSSSSEVTHAGLDDWSATSGPAKNGQNADLEKGFVNPKAIFTPASGSGTATPVEPFSGDGFMPSQKRTSVRDEEDDREIDESGLVHIEKDDPIHPMNWPLYKKCIQTALLGCTTLVVTFASSVFSSGTLPVSREYDVGLTVSTLGTSLFVLGFSFGPLLWGPSSEFLGRKLPMLLGYFIFAIFQIPVAVAENVYTIFICRFFGGLFASAPLAIVGGALADFWTPVPRGAAMTFFAMATFGGPTLGPIIGGFVTKSYLGWRWTAYLTLIMAIAMFITCVFFLEESYVPVLAQLKARRLRYERNDWRLHSELDEKEFSVENVARVYLATPLKMLVFEPMIILLTIYISFIYGLLYALFGAYPVEFQLNRGWNQGVGALPFLSIFIGVCLGSLVVFAFIPRYARKMEANGGKPVPEERLVPMMIGAVLFPIGMFWFGWTSSSHVSSWVPIVLSGIPTGAGIILIFLQTLNYLVDAYLMHANSAIAANAFLRGLFGAGFPLFVRQMFINLGVDWAASLIGFIALGMIPVPIAFYFYGAKLRKMSKFAPS